MRTPILHVQTFVENIFVCFYKYYEVFESMLNGVVWEKYTFIVLTTDKTIALYMTRIRGRVREGRKGLAPLFNISINYHKLCV